jgi:hypothetical protein
MSDTDITWPPGEQERFEALRADAAAHGMTLTVQEHRGYPGQPHYLLRIDGRDEWIEFELRVMKNHIDYAKEAQR